MGGSDTARVIDGLASVEAVRRSARRPAGPRFQPSRTTLPALENPREGAPAQRKTASRIGHSAIPVRHEIVCYMCRYVFVVQGRIAKTVCPKCHEWLNYQDYVIDGEWTENITTIGRIEVAPAGIVRNAALLGREISLAGNIEEGSAEAFERLDLWPGARMDLSRLTFRDLLVRREGRFILKGKILCRNVEVEGTLKAKIVAEGVLTVRAGGVLQGDVRTAHLVVEDGAGLKASLNVGPGALKPEEEEK